MHKEILPLGSVVSLKDAEMYFIIIGYKMLDEKENKVWDYLGCVYPVGVLSNDTTLVFDKEKIDKVIFTGFSDKEGEEFRKKISASIGDEK